MIDQQQLESKPQNRPEETERVLATLDPLTTEREKLPIDVYQSNALFRLYSSDRSFVSERKKRCEIF